jgi:SAM-dependent methyltransferase
MNHNVTDEMFDKWMSGESIYGDEFTLQEIEQWYCDEEHASHGVYIDVDTTQYRTLNWELGFKYLKGKIFNKCLGLGVADGNDIEPLAYQVNEFYCIEPEEKWWKTTIGLKTAHYFRPKTDGNLDIFPDQSFDLAIAIGCLHHIPNVSFVIKEMGRKLRSGGMFLIREPETAMGDWRSPREMMTPRERGLPIKPLLIAVKKSGLTIKAVKYFGCPVVIRLSQMFGINPYTNKLLVYFDWLLSTSMKWNLHYLPKNILEKIAPSQVFILAEKIHSTNTD